MTCSFKDPADPEMVCVTDTRGYEDRNDGAETQVMMRYMNLLNPRIMLKPKMMFLHFHHLSTSYNAIHSPLKIARHWRKNMATQNDNMVDDPPVDANSQPHHSGFPRKKPQVTPVTPMVRVTTATH